MKRKMMGFHKDERDDWVAELDCYHGQHVRHQPPFFNRAWTETEYGRQQMLGEKLNCVRCDALELPEGLSMYKQTPEFTETTIPKGLLNNHATKAGTWGVIHVLAGSLIYSPENHQNIELEAGQTANIPPQMIHSVKAKAEVRFYVGFLSLDKDSVTLPDALTA